MPTTGIVLCGGRSTRMGRPKALLAWRGSTLVETVISVLRAVVNDVIVVTSGAFDLPPLDARIVADREPHLGPLGGIRDGLHAAGSGLAFVASTDSPFLSAAFIESMLSLGGAAAVEMDGHVQTLGAVYDAALASRADELIAEGRMRPLFLLEASGYRRVSPEEIDDPGAIRGFNRPQEYLDALRVAGVEDGAVLEFFGRARARAGREQVDVPIGTLGDVLGRAEPALRIIRNGEVDSGYLVSLNAQAFVRDPLIPVGPGDRVIVMDSAVGG